MARRHRLPKVEWMSPELGEADLPPLGEGSYSSGDSVELGAGRHAVVYHQRTPSGRDVALKRIRQPSYRKAGAFTTTFVFAQNEAAILRNLQHPNIVRLMAVILEENELADGSSWGSMNLLQELAAMNLWQFIERHGHTELGPALLRSFTQNILDALVFLHANRIVHHDIKPHNLLVSDDLQIKLCDFGNARLLESTDEVLADGIGKGSTPYCAPEIFGRTGYTIKVDVYSAGVVLWVMLTGKAPFAEEANNVVMIVRIRAGGHFVCPSTCLDGSPVPAGFAALVDGMVAVDAAARLSAPEAAARFAALPPR